VYDGVTDVSDGGVWRLKDGVNLEVLRSSRLRLCVCVCVCVCVTWAQGARDVRGWNDWHV
jgi:hypothetical protein